MKPASLVLLFALLLCGCATTKLSVAGTEPVLELPMPEARKAGGITGINVTLPPGDYVPAFRDAAGTYYRPAAAPLWLGKPMAGAYVYISDDPTVLPKLYLEGALKMWTFEPELKFVRK